MKKDDVIIITCRTYPGIAHAMANQWK